MLDAHIGIKGKKEQKLAFMAICRPQFRLLWSHVGLSIVSAWVLVPTHLLYLICKQRDRLDNVQCSSCDGETLNFSMLIWLSCSTSVHSLLMLHPQLVKIILLIFELDWMKSIGI